MTAINQEDIKRFIETYTGAFSNKEQARNNPKNFAHINIYVRKLPHNIFKDNSFYSEQSYDYNPWSPYRQSVQRLFIKKRIFILTNYRLINPERFAGGGFNTEILERIKISNLLIQKGCSMHFCETNNGNYIGELEPGCKCIVKRGSIKTYVSSAIQLNKKGWISIDEGFDINTKEKVWGSNHGPIKFKRIGT